MQRRRSIGPEQALQKARHYCGYQERSHSETRRKLAGFGLARAEVDRLLASLIEEGYLNEERFATAFAGGRFRVKKWGRNRIVHELRMRGVAEANIRQAMGTIEEADYRRCLEQLARKKWRELRALEGLPRERSAKTTSYLVSRGFEAPLVRTVVASIDSTDAE
jgi:regulatory protein